MYINNYNLTITLVYKSKILGVLSFAHLPTDSMNLTKPVSFGFSKPLNKRFFITATNSRLLS